MKIGLTILAICALVQVKAQSIMEIHAFDDASTFQQLDLMEKITFDNGQMVIHGQNPSSTDLTDIRKLTFDSEIIVESIDESIHSNHSIYPNPSGSYAFLRWSAPLSDASSWVIYNLNGATMLSGLAEAGDTSTLLPTHQLPAGMYLVRFNDQMIKMIKR